MSTIPITGYYLENRNGSHRKFYTVLIADNGVVVTAWGRIGTGGQSKIQKLSTHSDAEALGMRQVYAKQTGGYSVVSNAFKFAVEEEVLNEACRRSITTHLTRAFHDAQRDPQYQGEKQSVLKHYDDFVTKAQKLMDAAGDRAFDEVWSEFEELENAWKEIADKHDAAAVTIGLTRQMLSQRLMSGAL